jgi:2'-5' RNA ligase
MPATSDPSAGHPGLRLFLAFDLPEEHRAEIGRRAGRVKKELPAARWVPAENLHLTLAFLGETEPERVEGLIGAVRPAFADFRPLELAVAGGGTFPPNRPARVAWVGIEGPPELMAVQRRVAGAATETLGLKPERRPFHPHVTLARPRRSWNRRASERFAGAFEGRVGEPFTVAEGVLYRSDLTPRGAIYTVVERFALRAGSQGGDHG